jgi:4a-hydroxytetrahydrobiopterin dehydratase
MRQNSAPDRENDRPGALLLFNGTLEEPTVNPFSRSEIAAKLPAHPGWTLDENGRLVKEYVFKNFSQTMLFANAVAYLAERADHHPDLFIHDYKHLKISLMSHDAGGITERDFDLIGQIAGLM